MKMLVMPKAMSGVSIAAPARIEYCSRNRSLGAT